MGGAEIAFANRSDKADEAEAGVRRTDVNKGR